MRSAQLWIDGVFGFCSLVGVVLMIIAYIGHIQYPWVIIALRFFFNGASVLIVLLKIIEYIRSGGTGEEDEVSSIIIIGLFACGIVGFCFFANHMGPLSSLFLATFCIMGYVDFQKRVSLEEVTPISDGAEVETSAISSCSICKRPGIHEVCLSCEDKYAGERHRVRAQILRAKRAGVPATLTLAEWIDTLNALNWKCVYCQTSPYTVLEHFVPISQGGGTTRSNCVPSCVSCNSQKSNKHPDHPFVSKNGSKPVAASQNQ